MQASPRPGARAPSLRLHAPMGALDPEPERSGPARETSFEAAAARSERGAQSLAAAVLTLMALMALACLVVVTAAYERRV
jgi:hypothetical protein